MSEPSDFEIVALGTVDSTNRVAAERGRPWQVFTAEYQTAGRGRLDHRWLAPPGVNLAMSVVLPVGDRTLEETATLPLTIGYAVLDALRGLSPSVFGGLSPDSGGLSPRPRLTLKWPNDILIDGLKVAGILCERHGDNVIAGIGVNVKAREFPSEIANTATYLEKHWGTVPKTAGTVPMVAEVRDAILEKIGEWFERTRTGGFAAVYGELVKVDQLRGQSLAVRQTDDDREPIRGVCGGILPDGSLDVGGRKVYAGEAHVMREGK